MRALIESVISPEQAVVLAGSAAVVLLMIAAAFALGFRDGARLDEARLRELAAAEGAQAEGLLIAANGRLGVSRLSGGRLLVARVMADGISSRVAPVARVRLGNGRLKVTFADLGFPPLHMRFKEAPPAWLADMAQGASP